MPKFLTFHSPSPKDLRENPIKALWESFQSLDQFTKGFLIVILLFILATPFIIGNLQIFNPRAQQPEGPTLGKQATDSVPDEILVKFKPGVADKHKNNIRHAYGLKKQDEIEQIGVEIVKVPKKVKDKVIEALKKNPRVLFAEPNYIGEAQDTPNDPDYIANKQYGLSRIRASAAWDISKGNPAVIVAVLDSAVKADHVDLAGKLVPGFNYLTSTTDTSFDNNLNGHGTQVSGVVGAITNNSTGIASLGREVSIMPVVIVTSTGIASFFNVSRAVTYAADHGARVINMSLGGCCVSTALQNAINYAWSKNIVLAAAAGNFNSTPILYPAAEPNVIAVGGTDSNDARMTTTNYGSGLDVMAPGLGIYTTHNNGGYATVSGTSFSTPYVVALAALMFSANPNLTNQQVNDIITSTADKILSGYNENGWSPYLGYGRINAQAAMQKATGIIVVPTPTLTPTSTPIPTPTPSYTPTPTLSPTPTPTVLTSSTPIPTNTPTNTPTPTPTKVPPTPTPSPTPIPTAIPTPTPVPDDTTNPTVSISSPSSGANVSGGVDVNVAATDDRGVTKVELFVDGSFYASTLVTPYLFYLDTTALSNGSHSLTAKAYDLAGHVGSSAAVTVNVNNTVVDKTDPIVSVVSPLSGTTVSVNVNTAASATDNVVVATTSIFVDNDLVTTCSGGSCSYTLDTTQYPNGSHTISAKALDSSTNLGESTPVSVNVNNTVSTPTPTKVPPTPTPTKTVSSDTTPPTVSITNPLNGATVARNSTITITASPSDNVGITRVEFYINNELSPKCIDTTPPYTCSWKVPGKPNASYTLTAKAYDPSGNTGTASVVVKTK